MFRWLKMAAQSADFVSAPLRQPAAAPSRWLGGCKYPTPSLPWVILGRSHIACLRGLRCQAATARLGVGGSNPGLETLSATPSRIHAVGIRANKDLGLRHGTSLCPAGTQTSKRRAGSVEPPDSPILHELDVTPWSVVSVRAPAIPCLGLRPRRIESSKSRFCGLGRARRPTPWAASTRCWPPFVRTRLPASGLRWSAPWRRCACSVVCTVHYSAVQSRL